MRWLNKLRLRVRSLIDRDGVDRELARELQFHLDRQIEENAALGMAPEEARAAAFRTIGNLTRIQQQCRDTRGIGLLEDLGQDLRFCIRALVRNPGFAAVAILTLAFGIGANTAIFSVINNVLLRPLPLANADRLVTIVENRPDAEPFDGRPQRRPPLGDEIDALRSQTQTLSDVYAYSGAPEVRIPGREDGLKLQGASMPSAAMTSLGARLLLGRFFEDNDRDSIVLSAEAWQRHFNGQPDVLGQTLSADVGNVPSLRTTRTFTVIGVVAPGFAFPRADLDYWMRGGGAPFSLNIARLKDGVSLEAAASEIDTILHHVIGKTPVPGAARLGPPRFELIPLHESVVGRIRPTLRLLALVVVLVLLIASANVANLLLARATARQREIAVRVAIGAARGRLIRQMLTESLLLSCLGGVAGILLAFAGVRLLQRLFASFASATVVRQVGAADTGSFPRLDEIHIDSTTFLFTAGVCVITGLVFGLLPAWRHTGRVGIDSLRDGAAPAISGFGLFRRHSMRSGLVVVQVALAMTLLVGGALVVHSLVNLLTVDKGFDPSNVLTFQVTTDKRRASVQDLRAFAAELTERLKTLPRVRSAAYTHEIPLVGPRQRTPLLLFPSETLPESGGPGESSVYHPDLRLVSEDYFDVVGMRIVSGRGFRGREAGRGSRVLLINETLARGRFPGENPIGRQVYLRRQALGAEPWEIGGIVEDSRQQGIDVAAQPQMFADLGRWPSFAQAFDEPQYYAVRTTDDPTLVLPEVRSIVRQLDPGARLDQVLRMEDVVASALARPRAYAVLFTIFSGLGLVLAAIGIYGVMAYAVAQSTRELGVRLALGARRQEIVAMVLGRAAILAGTGIVLGVLGALGVTRYLQGMLFGLTPLDAATFVFTALVFGVVAMVASYVPARRATQVDPLIALRSE